MIGPFRQLLAVHSRGVRTLVELLSAMVAAWGASTGVVDLDETRRTRIFLDLSLAILRGILVDDIIAKGFGSIDHLEFKDWLRKHNASADSADSAIIDSIYDGNFSFVGGDCTKPNLAAGVALHCYTEDFSRLQGSVPLQDAGGHGDVVIAPLYLALKQRGVQFRFFHKVEELIYDATKNQIAAIRMTEQVALNGEYDPLVTVPLPEGGIECWPSTLRYESIRDGAALAASGINLESHWARPWKDSHAKTLSVGTDYHLVVLGISIGGLPLVCQQLVDHFPEWRSMIEKVDTVATQSMQLWLSPSIGDLGWTLPSPLVVNYEDPASNWLDASQVIPGRADEGFPCRIGGVLLLRAGGRTLHPTVRSAHVCRGSAAGRAAVRTGSGSCSIPASCGRPMANIAGRPGVVNWDLLHDPLNRVGPARLAGQYFRANVQPSDRFVLSSVGATAFRLPPNDSKVGNLLLAGDWTNNGFNCGCVEATVISGLLCSRAISRISTPLLRRTPLRDVQPLRLPAPDGVALSPTRSHFVARTKRFASSHRRRVSC